MLTEVSSDLLMTRPWRCSPTPHSIGLVWLLCSGHWALRLPSVLTQALSLWVTTSTAGSQHGRSHPWQGHVERPDGQGKSGLKGSSVWASTPKPKSVCLLSAILYSSDITGGYPRKSLFRAPVNSLLHIKRMSWFKPLWWLSNLPDRSARTFTTCDCLQHPQLQEACSLKHLKDTEPFRVKN